MLLTFLTALVLSPPVFADKGVVVGYYPSWVRDEFPPSAIDFGSFTHIGHAFLTGKPDGSVVPDGSHPVISAAVRAWRGSSPSEL
jgi:GH18 family chitinase